MKVNGPAPRSKQPTRGLGTPSGQVQKGPPRPGQQAKARAISSGQENQANQAKCQCCGPAWAATGAICWPPPPRPEVSLCSRAFGVSE